MQLAPGDHVLLPAPGAHRGLARVVSRDDAGTVLELLGSGTKMRLLPDHTFELAPPLTRETATSLLAVLESKDAQPDERSYEYREATSTRTLFEGTWAAMAERLATLYASRWKPTIGHRSAISTSTSSGISIGRERRA